MFKPHLSTTVPLWHQQTAMEYFTGELVWVGGDGIAEGETRKQFSSGLGKHWYCRIVGQSPASFWRIALRGTFIWFLYDFIWFYMILYGVYTILYCFYMILYGFLCDFILLFYDFRRFDFNFRMTRFCEF